MNVLEKVVDIARSAGAAIQEIQASSNLEIASKGLAGPVTLADQRSDALLRNGLERIDRAAWLSEESVDDLQRLEADRVWVVDPLDGTKEFIEGLPQYAIAIGLVEHGEAILGVVHNPATGETFSAERGSGAWIGSQRLTVNDSGPLLASRTEMKSGEFSPFADAGFELQPIGSIAYKLALVAAGRASLTLSRGPKWEWDVCAGSLLVREAGGTATDVFGEALRFNQSFPKTRGIMAGAERAYARAKSFVRSVGASDRMTEFEDRGGSKDRSHS